MKRYFLRLTTILFFLVIPLFRVLADTPLDNLPPPGPGGSGGGTPVGAPIDNGLSILLMLGASYGLWKLYKSRKQDNARSLAE